MEAFLQRLGNAVDWTWGQLRVGRDAATGHYEVRHVADAAAGVETLVVRTPREMRTWVQHNEQGAFRPLRTSPDLKRGWRLMAPTAQVLEEALECIYPGGLADWFAGESEHPPVTHFREFTQRQTGMFRVITRLDDVQAAEAIRACCAPAFCLRRRLWTVDGLAPDGVGPSGKSDIACLEPCALLMELARKAARLHQDAAEKGLVTLQISREDMRTVREALEKVRDCPESDGRQADFGDRLNPRRVQWLLERLPQVEEKAAAPGGSE